jgi:hypothetical protein
VYLKFHNAFLNVMPITLASHDARYRRFIHYLRISIQRCLKNSRDLDSVLRKLNKHEARLLPEDEDGKVSCRWVNTCAYVLGRGVQMASKRRDSWADSSDWFSVSAAEVSRANDDGSREDVAGIISKHLDPIITWLITIIDCAPISCTAYRILLAT